MNALDHRCVGLEQEFFLVDVDGVLSNLADEFLARGWEPARTEGRDPACFAPEVARSMVEVNVPPARSLPELSRDYLDGLELAIETGRSMGQVYPLGTCPLPVTPDLREEPRYQPQARTVGEERFSHAGRCAGVVGPRVGVSYGVPEEARTDLLGIYNLATALDPAIVTLTRSSPFYEGVADGRTPRTLHYRGDPDLAPHGLYGNLWEVGGLPLTLRTSRSWSSSSSPGTAPGSRPWTAPAWGAGSTSRRVMACLRPHGTPWALTPKERSSCAG